MAHEQRESQEQHYWINQWQQHNNKQAESLQDHNCTEVLAGRALPHCTRVDNACNVVSNTPVRWPPFCSSRLGTKFFYCTNCYGCIMTVLNKEGSFHQWGIIDVCVGGYMWAVITSCCTQMCSKLPSLLNYAAALECCWYSVKTDDTLSSVRILDEQCAKRPGSGGFASSGDLQQRDFRCSLFLEAAACL